MTIEEVKATLRKKGISEKLYTFGNSPQDDRIVIEESISYYSDNNSYKEWSVFYFERGVRYDEKKHFSENEACIDILNRLVKYKTRQT